MDPEIRQTYVLSVRHAGLDASGLDERIQLCEEYLKDCDSQDPEFIFLLADSYGRKGFTPAGVVDTSWLVKALELFTQLPNNPNNFLHEKAADYQSRIHGIIADHMLIDSAGVDKENKTTLENSAAERRQHYSKSVSPVGFRWVSYLSAKYSPEDTLELEKKKWRWAAAMFSSPLSENSEFNELYSVPRAKLVYLELKGREKITAVDLPEDNFLYKANMILASYFLQDQKLSHAEIALEKAHAQLEELLPREVDPKKSEEISSIIDYFTAATPHKKSIPKEFFSDTKEKLTIFRGLYLPDLRERHLPFHKKDRIPKKEWQRLCELSKSKVRVWEQELEKVQNPTAIFDGKAGGYSVIFLMGMPANKDLSPKNWPYEVIVSKDDGSEPDQPDCYYPYFYRVWLHQDRLLIFKTGYGQSNLSLDDFIKNEALLKKDKSTLESSLTAVYREAASKIPNKAQEYYSKILNRDSHDAEASLFLARAAFRDNEFEKAKEYYKLVYSRLRQPSAEELVLSADEKLLLDPGDFAAYLFSRYVTGASMSTVRNLYWRYASQSADTGLCQLILKMDQARDERIPLNRPGRRQKHFGFDPLHLHPKAGRQSYKLIWEELRKLEKNQHLASSAIAELSKKTPLPENKDKK